VLLKNISPLHAAIIEGGYDDELESLRQTINHRIKMVARNSGLRPGVIIELVNDPSAGDLAGLQARVVRVNQKSISIDLIGDDIPDWKRGYRVSPKLIRNEGE